MTNESSGIVVSRVARRVGDVQRAAYAEALADAFAKGELSRIELDARTELCLAAVTDADLARLVADLLVLEHTGDYPNAGIQVPAGGVDPGESPAAAATRELFEETGLHARQPPIYLQSCWWPDSKAPSRIRHYYWVEAPRETPAAWSHVVSAGEDDKGKTFLLNFRPLTHPDLTPGYGWANALPRLSTTMNQR